MVTLSRSSPSNLLDLLTMLNDYGDELRPYYPEGVVIPAFHAGHGETLLVNAQDALAGFIIVDFNPCIPGVSGHYLAEFYIKPEFRNSHAAMQAGGMAVRRNPGEWTADVLAANAPSLRFTRAMTRRYGKNVRDHEIETPVGAAVRFRWTVGG
jgi:predicted acetyltransferase